ncbi:MAG: flagellar hook-basal body complex protein FliE [Flavobacteriales bacterium]|jgi:flagellar hook-basal body complex protein FliE
MISNRMDVNRLMLEMRALKSQTQAFGATQGIQNLEKSNPINGIQETGKTSFTNIMEQAVNKVNEVQHASGAVSKAYLQGDQNVGVTDVMIASQKAGVAFDAAVQVRNKLVDAYRDVMNMPI